MRNHSVFWYSGAAIFTMLGVGYASAPLYKLFCTTTGFGGTAIIDPYQTLNINKMKPISESTSDLITVRFSASKNLQLPWTFEPCQEKVAIRPGETALAFYTATNLSDHDVCGISTYTIVPPQFGPYFNKIQCFCFEEQKLAAKESVDMPVYFYIDPEMMNDRACQGVHHINLCYTFFPSKTYLDSQNL